MIVIDETNFKPLRALILIRRDNPDDESDGILIPKNVQTYGWRAIVLRTGPEAQKYRLNDAILFQKEFTMLPFRNRDLALTEANHVLAKLDVVENVERIIPHNKFVLIRPQSVETKSHGIFLIDKSVPPPMIGIAIRVGGDCHEVKPEMKVWFEQNVGVNCVEDGENYKLIDESNILAMQAWQAK